RASGFSARSAGSIARRVSSGSSPPASSSVSASGATESLVRVEVRAGGGHVVVEDRRVIGGLEHVQRVVGLAVTAHLEVQVGAGGMSAAAHGGDGLAGVDLFPFFHQIPQIVGIKGDQTIGMLDLHDLAICP